MAHTGVIRQSSSAPSLGGLLRRRAAYLAFALASACSSEGVEVTAYPMICEAPVVNQECSGRATPLNRDAFRVFASSQQVVSWLPGISETPRKLERCSVRDGQNWKCHLPREEGEIGFSNGSFFERLNPPRDNQDKFFYVSSVRWWWNQLVASEDPLGLRGKPQTVTLSGIYTELARRNSIRQNLRQSNEAKRVVEQYKSGAITRNEARAALQTLLPQSLGSLPPDAESGEWHERDLQLVR